MSPVLPILDLSDAHRALPQCSMNSFSMHPFEYRGSREVSHYVDGDFIVHMAGKKGRTKLIMMDYYLGIAEGKGVSALTTAN